jgi:post-segregation antitoxin (ccd killing protein)
MRANVYLPNELAETVRRELPDINVSAVLQRALAALLGCTHDELVCAACATPVDHKQLVDVALGRFFVDLMWELRTLVDRGGTVEGAARVLKHCGELHHITTASSYPLPRRSRAQRAAAADREHEQLHEQLHERLPLDRLAESA